MAVTTGLQELKRTQEMGVSKLRFLRSCNLREAINCNYQST
jgi:hypothetical protein